MANLCIIPARGGSKRIPKKNIRDFLGKPIIAYSIQAAIASGLFDVVMVSTDDEEIASIAQSWGAEVPFMRSQANANDFATTADVIQEVLSEYSDKNMEFDSVCCLYPCAPFVNATKIKESFKLLKGAKYDVVIPVIPYAYPIQRALKVRDDRVSFFSPEYETTRSQDLEKSYHDVGQFYWLDIDAFMHEHKVFMKNGGALIVSELEAQDIDVESDWKIAELKYKLWKE